MKKIIYYLSLLCLLCLLDPSLRAYNFNAPTKENAGLRSLLIPGWGQFYNNQKLKGLLFGTTAYASLAGGLSMYFLAQKDFSDYEARGIADDPLYDTYKQKITVSNICFGVSAAVWIYSVIDAYICGSTVMIYKADKKTDMRILIAENNCCLNYSYQY